MIGDSLYYDIKLILCFVIIQIIRESWTGKGKRNGRGLACVGLKFAEAWTRFANKIVEFLVIRKKKEQWY